MKQVSMEISKKMLDEMCTDKFKKDFWNMLRSRYPLFYLTTNEERRFIDFVTHFCKVRGYNCRVWDSYRGLSDLFSKEEIAGTTQDLKANPFNILEYIINEARTYQKKKTTIKEQKEKGINGTIYILLDFFRFITDNPDIERRFKTLVGLNSPICTILTGPYYHSTDVLHNLMPVLDFPFANQDEIKHALYDVARGASKDIPGLLDETKEMEEQLINSVSGLTLVEAQTAFSKSLVDDHSWDIPLILEEKKQIISKSGMLEYFDKPVSLNDVGGLKRLVKWIRLRKKSFSQEAAEYGLKKPRGLLSIGMPGCGKSLVCKAISSEWEMPLLRLDFGKLFGSLVGDSEKNAREAIKLAEAVAPSILWIDEIEKAISGVQSSGRSDGGTTSRVLSTFLTWMQEKTSSVFVVATANNHKTIPPEFLRAGRFDEIFFVDLPNTEEREEIFEVLMRLRNIDTTNLNTPLLAEKSKNYSGAEIEKGIDNAMLAGFLDNKRVIGTDDIIKALGEFKSLYDMRKGDFIELREWAEQRCLMANEASVDKIDYGSSERDLDL